MIEYFQMKTNMIQLHRRQLFLTFFLIIIILYFGSKLFSNYTSTTRLFASEFKQDYAIKDVGNNVMIKNKKLIKEKLIYNIKKVPNLIEYTR